MMHNGKPHTNPFTEILYVQFEDTKARTIQLLDAQGRKVKEISTSDAMVKIERVDLPSGVYYLQVTEGEKRMVKKLVIK